MLDINRSFGALVRKTRGEAGITQEQLAQRIGLSRTTITNIEKGNQGVALQQLFELATALGRDPRDLIPNIEVRSYDMSPQILGLVESESERNQKLLLSLRGVKADATR